MTPTESGTPGLTAAPDPAPDAAPRPAGGATAAATAPAAPPGPAGTRWEPGRRFVLRAAGLPIETVHGLRCPRTRRWAEVVLTDDTRLTAAGAEPSDPPPTPLKATTC